jgi:hypothetical protein
LQLDDNEDSSKTDDTANLANFGMELDIEPETVSAQEPAENAGGYAWRGAVTKGSKEKGFEINLIKTKEVPNDDQRGRSTRRLTFSATIVPGEAK